MTHPHEGLQERALDTPSNVIAEMHRIKSLFVPSDDDKEDLITYAKEIVLLRSTPPVPQGQGLRDALSVTDWLAVAKLAGENGIRYRTNAALERFLSALSPHLSSTLPQQAATDEGEMPWHGERPERVCEAIAEFWSKFEDERSCGAYLPEELAENAGEFANDLFDHLASAAQPEPTDPQRGEEGDALQSIRRVLAGIEGNPKGDALDREAASVAMKLIDAIGKAG